LARTVLLADDSVTAQNMGRRILMDAGYEVVTVNNGSAALKKIHEHRPDLIVLDVYMPGYGGLEVCQRLKESPDTARIPVLLSVGKMEPFKADEAKRVRADGHIVKPFEASELLAALTKLEDRIVPADSREGRTGKAERKGRTWQTEDTVIGADAANTDRVAHLSEAKKRHASSASDEAAARQNKDNQEVAVAASGDQPTAGSAAVTAAEVQAPAIAAEVPATVEASTAETTAVQTPEVRNPELQKEDSQAWVLGKSLFGKPVHGEIALGDSIFDKTIFGKSAASGSVSEAVPEAATLAIASAHTPRWIAESVALTAEEAALDLDAEMQRSRAITAAVAIAAEIPPPDQVTTSDAVVAQSAPGSAAELETVHPAGAAFAAAAAAGAASAQRSAAGTQPAAGPDSAETAGSSPEVELPAAYEAAAAWENWQQIRETVMSPKQAEAIAQATVTAPESASESATNQDPTPSVIAAAAAAEEASSLNDIVDSVLADMKPRLMAEIAKKLAAKK
jgi:CheY-like chemotaxis protein